ncbi:restriction endonuclease subunit S [Luteibacter sp. CQ10]|uniref:restriction endonuclease subunit S n=1 Tax=Luteibacter sp. CQ10 TaxID=2805821 RepID=UPI0034A5BC3B
MTTKEVSLGEICEITMGQAPDGESYNTEQIGIPLIAGAGDFGVITPEPSKFTTAPTKRAKVDDIILCIRATIGDRNWADQQYCLGRGVASLRAESSRLDQRFLWHWLGHASPALKAKGRGATFLQVSKADIASLRVSLPSLRTQRRVAEILDKVEDLRRKRRESVAVLNRLLRSSFLEMFGDVATNPKAWPIGRLADLGDLERGISRHRPRGAPELLGGDHPLIQTGDVARSCGYIRQFSSTYSDAGLSQSKKWPRGTLCITIAANIADTGILTFPACFPDSVVGFTPNDGSNVEFVQGILGFLKKIIEETAPQVAQKNINLAILRDLPIPIPPKSLQDKWARFATRVEEMKQDLYAAQRGMDRMAAAVQSKAFAGTLWP